MIKLPEKSKKILDDFCAGMAEATGDNLVSLIVFGSAAREDYNPRSAIDLCVILKNAGTAQLQKVIAVTGQRRFSSVNALFFTEEYLRRSADVFPIEFLDMRDHHIVIKGSDLLAELVVEMKHLGFQCEHELKAKLLQLRRAYVRDAGRERIRELLKYAASCGHILKSFYRLKTGSTVSTEEALSRISQETGSKNPAFAALLAAKKAGTEPRGEQARKLFAGFIDELDGIVSAVDRMRPDAQ